MCNRITFFSNFVVYISHFRRYSPRNADFWTKCTLNAYINNYYYFADN